MRILYLDLDSLRPDHLSCYGYHRRTSPNLDRLAESGTGFTNCYATDIPCAPSRTALMTGQFGIHNGLVCHFGTAGDLRNEGCPRDFSSRLSKESLPGFLRNQGFDTTSISPFSERHGTWGFNAGFLNVINTGMFGMESAEHVMPTAMDWITRNAARDDWFLHINFWDPHMPTRFPLEYGDPYTEEPLADWITEEEVARQVNLRGLQVPYWKQRSYRQYAEGSGGGGRVPEGTRFPRCTSQIESLADVKRIIDGYDGSVRYLDENLGRLINAFTDAGVWDDMVVVVSADHGENLGELGIYGDHKTADFVTTHVPLIVRCPEGQAGNVDEGLHYHLDLAPTLAELNGSEALECWDGKSYAPAIQSAEVCGWNELVLSSCWGTCQRSVRFDHWFYTHTYHDGYNGFPERMLFDLFTDPHQRNNLAATHPPLCEEAETRLSAWHQQMIETMANPDWGDPMQTVLTEGGPMRGALPQLLAEMEEIGAHEAAEQLRRRHADEL